MDKEKSAKIKATAKREALKAKKKIDEAGKKIQAFIKKNPEKAAVISAAAGAAIGAAVVAAIVKAKKKK